MSFRIIKKMAKGYAVYWAPLPEGDDGEKTYAAPVQLRVRWEGMTTRFRDQYGAPLDSREVVYSLVDLAKGGALWSGKLTDCPTAKKTAPYDPFAADQLAWEIQKFSKFPTLRYKKFLRISFL